MRVILTPAFLPPSAEERWSILDPDAKWNLNAMSLVVICFNAVICLEDHLQETPVHQ